MCCEQSSTTTRATGFGSGCLAGIGFETKYSIAFLLFGVVVGLLLTPERHFLKSGWLWLGVLACGLIALPNFMWQLHYHFPFLELMHNIRIGIRDIVRGPVGFIADQAWIMNPILVPLWVGGVIMPPAAQAAHGVAGTFKTDIRRPGNPSEDFGAITINLANGSAGDSQIAIQNLGFPDTAAANATYSVRFCPMIPGTSSTCFHVTNVTTDANSRAVANFTFSQMGAFAGVFFFSRNGVDEFESIFQEDSGDSFYTAKLQPFSAAGFGASSQFGVPGNDSLTDGGVLHHDFTVFTFSVAGAMASSTYMVSFCPFGGSSSNCVSLGSLSTDASGNGSADLQFPSNTGGPFRVGAFVLSRGGTSEFISGFFVQH